MVRGEGKKGRGRGEVRREEEEKERTKRKRKEERDKSKVCREEKSREERKTQTKRGRGKRREKLAEGREETEGEESVFLAHCWNSFSPFTWQSFYPLIGPQKKLAHGWQSINLFSLILGSSVMSAHSLRSNFVFPFTWASHLLAKLEVIILLPCPWAFHFKPATFTKSYGYAGYALVLFTILG